MNKFVQYFLCMYHIYIYPIRTEDNCVNWSKVALEGFNFCASEKVELVDFEVFAGTNEH